MIDHAPNTRHFALAVPVPDALEAQLDRVHVVGPEGDADAPRSSPSDRFGASIAGIGGNARTAVVRAVGSPMVSASCTDAGAQGVLAIDASTGTVVGTRAGATVHVMMTSGRQLTVLCSDGVRTRRATVTMP